MTILQKYSAIVQYGRKLGRKLGFPTANINLDDRLDITFGIYIVKVIHDEIEYFGVANYGVKPTIGDNKIGIEVHILNFDKDIYGQPIHIYFIYKIRNEQQFSSTAELQAQIKKDVDFSKKYISELENR